MGQTYYETLGVTKSSPPEEVTKRYRQLAKTYHPDRNPGDPAAEVKFKEVSEAYDVLNDPLRRSQYDSQGYVGRRPPPQPQYRPKPQKKAQKKPTPQYNVQHVRVFSKEELDAVKCQFFGGNDRILMGRHVLVTLVIKKSELGRTFEVAVKKRRHCNSSEAGNCEELENWVIEKLPVVVPTDHQSGNHIVIRGRGEKGRGVGGHAGNIHVAVIIQ